MDRGICGEWFDEDSADARTPALAVWVDRDVLVEKNLRGLEVVSVSIIHPAALESPLDPQQQAKNKRSLEDNAASAHTTKVVARLLPWDGAPDTRHVGLSSALSKALGADGLVGGLVRIEGAPSSLPKNAVKALKIFPFATSVHNHDTVFKFGGNAETRIEALRENLRSLYSGRNNDGTGILDGPITNGLVLPMPDQTNETDSWKGGVLRFNLSPDSSSAQNVDNQGLAWTMGLELMLNFDLQPEIPSPLQRHNGSTLDIEAIPRELSSLIGVESLVDESFFDLSHFSSVLLTGGLGSGKTCMARSLGHRLRSSLLYHTSYFPCQKLVTDETRVSTIKETLNRIFQTALWGARFGGHALVILDDLDKVCPAETELMIGNDNSRSRQISELICSAVRRYCSADSGVVLLATAQSRDSINTVIIGGHIVRKITNLKAPSKDARKRILEVIIGNHHDGEPRINGFKQHSRNSSNGDGAAWMDGSPPDSPSFQANKGRFNPDRNLDLLDLAGQTDGFMPGDLILLVSRARSEALIRAIDAGPDSTDTSIVLEKEDFQCALKGFTPASLRNVTLQTSKTSFDSIGGLHETRKILLETLQYPTIYAPIFAQCPLRLRSGLLLYGYPGCGKTLLASAIAGECGLNFISVKGPEILNKYIGASEKSVRDLFERAESAKPCVLFFDEFDSIAPKRGHDSTGVTDRVVNQLLTQMDGAEGLSGVYVLAATSRPDLIDPALLRPGRLDKSLICELPNLEDRLDILRALSKKLKISAALLDLENQSSQSLLEVAHRTEGYSGADLQAVMYNAHLEAIHDVLGDQPTTAEVNSKKRNDSSRKSTRSLPQRDLIQFRFGEDAPEKLETGSKQLVDNAAIMTKLDDMKAAKRRERQIRRGVDLSQLPSNDNSGDAHAKGHNASQEVVIEWKHIEASLATTRSSISVEEKRRLERIYREFTVGRNGEMPQGDGPRDIGGRSSLM